MSNIYKNKNFEAGSRVDIIVNPVAKMTLTPILLIMELDRYYVTVKPTPIPMGYNIADGTFCACRQFGGTAIVENGSITKIRVSGETFADADMLNVCLGAKTLHMNFFGEQSIAKTTKVLSLDYSSIKPLYMNGIDELSINRNVIEVGLNNVSMYEIEQLVMSDYVLVNSCNAEWKLLPDMVFKCANLKRLGGGSCNPAVRLGVVDTKTVSIAGKNNGYNVKIKLLG